MEEDMRRCGAHEVVLTDGRVLHQAVVEVMGGRVINYYEFREELPMTEWLGGKIEVRNEEEGCLVAYWNHQRL